MLEIYFTKNELSNGTLLSFSLKEYEDKEKLMEFLRNLANATYDNFREMTDIPNNPVKSDKYLHAIMQVSIVKYGQLLNHHSYKIDNLKLNCVYVSYCFRYIRIYLISIIPLPLHPILVW
jgi:hypothetical protein